MSLQVEKLPILISIPHGGTEIPKELSDRIVLSATDLFDDSDAFTREIYNADFLATVVINPVARAFVDVNRSLHQLPPAFPDGLIKSHTCMNKRIYKPGMQPGSHLVEMLIKKYYEPFHHQLKIELKKKKLIGLDCHSMLPFAPTLDQNSGQPRPLVNLGNLDGKSCPMIWVELLAESFCKIMKIPTKQILINTPFKGGYITQRWANKPIPWIQIELNRNLYLDEKWFNKKEFQIDKNRLNELNRLFSRILFDFIHKIS